MADETQAIEQVIPPEVQKEINNDVLEKAILTAVNPVNEKAKPRGIEKKEPVQVAVSDTSKAAAQNFEKGIVAQREKAEKDRIEKEAKDKADLAAKTNTDASPASSVTEMPDASSAPSVSLDEEISKKTNGKFKTYGELQKYIEDSEKVTSEYQRVNEELTSVKSKNPFANEYIEKLNTYVQGGGDPETFHRVMRVNVDTLSPEQKISLKIQWENKDITPEEADEMVAHKYKLYDDLDPEDREVKAARLNMKIDSRDADKTLRDTIVKETTPPAAAPVVDYEKEAEKHVEQWKPQFPKLRDENKVFVWKGKDGVEVKLDVDPAVLDSIEKNLSTVIGDYGMEPDAKGLEIAKNYFYNEIKAKSFDDIANKLINQMKAQFIKEKHNPSTDKETTAPTVTTPDATRILTFLQD